MAGFSRGILTMAYRSSRYIEMAKSLARSLSFHSPEVPRAIVTDSSDGELKTLFRFCVPLNQELGFGNKQKLYLDKYSPFTETMFIDCDCLVVRDIDAIWDYFKTVPFGIPGFVKLRRGDQDIKMDVDFILNYYNLDEIYKFNSGLIYFDSSELSKLVFDTARNLLSRYKELRFSRHEKPYDEPIFAVSMALNGLSAVRDEGRTMRTPAGLHGKLKIDVLQGACTFDKYGEVVEPAVVHFAGNSSKSFEYTRECFKLRNLSQSSNSQQEMTLVWLWLLAWFSSQSYKIRRLIRIRSRVSSFKKHLITIFN